MYIAIALCITPEMAHKVKGNACTMYYVIKFSKKVMTEVLNLLFYFMSYLVLSILVLPNSAITNKMRLLY